MITMKRCKYCNIPLKDETKDFCSDEHEKRYQLQKIDHDRNVILIILISLFFVIYGFIAVILESLHMLAFSISIAGGILLLLISLDNDRFSDRVLIWKRYYKPKAGRPEYPRAIVIFLAISIIVFGIILTIMI